MALCKTMCTFGHYRVYGAKADTYPVSPFQLTTRRSPAGLHGALGTDGEHSDEAGGCRRGSAGLS